MVLLKEPLKARVAAYKEAIEEAVKAAADAAVNAAVNVVAEAPPGEPDGRVIKLDDDKNKSHNKGAYAAFKKVIKVEDHKAYTKALCFRVNLVHSFLPFISPSAKTYYL